MKLIQSLQRKHLGKHNEDPTQRKTNLSKTSSALITISTQQIHITMP